jgi:3-oxoacyl-[acyl-carrier-protein] synthase-1
MKMPPDIIAAACSFPSGPTLPLGDCALRSQFALLHKHPFYLDRCGLPVRASYFPDLAFGFDERRWFALATSALDELAAVLAHASQLREWPCHLWLVLPHKGRCGVPAGLADQLAAAMQHECFAWRGVRTVHGGHAVGVHAIRQAAAAVQASETLAVVIAVDSWLHPDALQSLEDARLLHGAHVPYEGQARRNPYGRVPGEGAAAVALLSGGVRPCGDDGGHPKAWARLAGSALAEEAITFDTPEPCLGLGLTRAAQEALKAARSTAGTIGSVNSDLNGEPYRADEFGFTTLRLSDALAPAWRRVTPTLVSGDQGSASAIAQLALAAYRMHHRPEPGTERQLILCSSDDKLRAAMVIDAQARI